MPLYIAEQVCGWIGTVLCGNAESAELKMARGLELRRSRSTLLCIQLVPQVWMNYRRKTTEGLSALLCVCWCASGACLGIYAIVENINIPIIVQPHCYGGLCAVMLCQKLYYDRKWTIWGALGAFAAYGVATAGFEVGMVYASRHVEHHLHNNGLTMTWGILSDIFLVLGFVPQFYEIYKVKKVHALSYMFLFMDSLGAVFSILSLAFKSNLDVIAFIGYLAVLILEIVIVLLALVLNPRARRREAALAEDKQLDTEGRGMPSAQATLVDDEPPSLKCANLSEKLKAERPASPALS
ncbi:hypothetical protein BMF94_3466 [Rhodotorula taiwanensis]|uniref:Uncharacterized protein n=1 Tax=Rhodotorula taiwanensis TaxID=741276 RepID=A0A2S5B9U2_9BASI|nr:hypothetical protein BMF94_3466 [Rhodotorula taiwanensis]